jgi:phage-related baseplate assembly protein
MERWQNPEVVSVASKLQIKPGQAVCVIGRPLDATLDLGQELELVQDPTKSDAVIVYCTSRADLEQLSAPLLAAARRDAMTWVAYPKAGQLGTDLNRDTLAALIQAEGVRPVRQIAIDDLWSALRLRPA